MADKEEIPPQAQIDLISPDEMEGPDTQSSSISSSLGLVTSPSGNSGSITDVSELSTLPSSSSLVSTASSLEEVPSLSGNSASVSDFSEISPLPSSSGLGSSASSSAGEALHSRNLESGADVAESSNLPSSSSLMSTTLSIEEAAPQSSNLEIIPDDSEQSAVPSSHSLASTQSSGREGTPLSRHSESTSDISELSSLSELSCKTDSLNIQDEKPDSSEIDQQKSAAEKSYSPDLSIPLETINKFSESGVFKIDRHLLIFREIRKIAKSKLREKDLRVILKKFLSNLPPSTSDKKPSELQQPPAAESQSSEGASSESSNIPTAVSTGEGSSDVEEKIIKAVCGTEANSSRDELFLQDRLNSLADMLVSIESLTRLMREANIFVDTDADESAGPSSRLTSVEAVPTIVQLYEEARKSVESVSQWTNRLFNWCMTSNYDIQELREWLNEVNSLSESSGFQTVKDRLAAWESSRSSIDHLGNATCLLLIEKEISELLQTLIAEISLMQYKYWMDKGKETSRERGENGV